MSTCHDNPENPSITKISKHTLSGYSFFTQCSFNATKMKFDCYRDKDCMKKFCKDLKEYAIETINYEKEKMIPQTDEENMSYKIQKVCYICKKVNNDKTDKNSFKLYYKVRDHCHCTGKYRGAAHNIFYLRYKTPNKVPVVFHNDSTCDYHFIFNELAKRFEG